MSIPSNPSFEQTVDAFKAAVSKGGMMLMSTVDQGNMLKMTGLQRKGTLFLVGNPTVGKQVFEKDPGAVSICRFAFTSIRDYSGVTEAENSRGFCDIYVLQIR